MVFFSCNHCGSSLKKNKVEKHYAVECRKPPAVSCMDCFKDFYGEEYVSHNKCVTEQQKYSGQPIDDKAQLGKGERKQIEWVETVRQIVETKGPSLTPQERQVLEKMKDFENIPRKKKKFENFLKNAIGRYVDPHTIEKVWSLLEAQKVESSKEAAPGTKENVQSPTKVEEETGKKKEEEQPEVEPENAEQSPAKETAKLSKKEKKEKKKKQKYELELENISKEKALDNDTNLGDVDMDLDQGEAPEEGKGGKSKKKKKKEKIEEEQNSMENDEAVVVNGSKGGEKKKGKRKHNGNVEDEGGNKKRKKGGVEKEDETVYEDAGVTETGVNGDTSDEIKKKGKFKWDKTILAVLQAVADHELPVKRLRKKVLSEYQEALGEGKCQELSLEEALGTFERKLHKIPGVKVHKDKAKLVKKS